MKNNKNNNPTDPLIPILELIKISKFDEAIIMLEKIKNLDPHVINRLKGSIYLNKKEWKYSLTHYQKIPENFKNFKIYNNIGVSLYKLGRFKESIEEFNKSINIKNDFLPAYENLGIVYKHVGNYEKSIKFTTEALKLSPKNNKMTNNLLEILNFFQPKEQENLLIKSNNQISKLTLIKNNDLKKDFLISKILSNSEKIIQKNKLDFIYNESQIYRRNGINLNCERHFGIFNKYKIIPKYCFSCYKVQINLKNVFNLIKLYFYFNNLNLNNNNIRKCMVELRENVTGNYKGYLYANSITEAENLVKNIKFDLTNYGINFDRIEIKHGCTEYYEVFSLFKNIEKNLINKIYQKKWEQIEYEFDKTNLIEDKDKEKIFNRTINKYSLPDYLIIKNWILYASLINDLSYKKVFNFNIETNHISKRDLEKIKKREPLK